MKLDTSVAPELALLAAPPAAVPAPFATAIALPATPAPTTPGRASPGTTAPGRAAPGPATPNSAAPGTAVSGAAAPGTAAPAPAALGPAAPNTAAPGTAVLGAAAPGTAAPVPAAPGSVVPGVAATLAGSVTVGYLAACLRFLVADPGRWWDLVRFDPERPVHIPVVAPAPGCETWLLVLPPGYQGEEPGLPPRGGVSCLVAGAVTEQAAAPGDWQDRPLSPGRTRVHGSSDPSRLINSGAGYAVTLHARPLPG